jgi:hypothetical protein
MWVQLIVIVLGIWLMVSPAVIRYSGLAAHHAHAVGPFIATFACVSIWEVVRPVRWANVVLGIWLLISPALLHFRGGAAVTAVCVGLLTVALSLIRGRQTHRFAGGWRTLLPGWQLDPPPPSSS